MVAEGAALPAEGDAEGVVAVPAEDFFPAESGNLFGLLVEKEDAAIQVVRDNPLFEIIEDAGQVLPGGQNSVQVDFRHGLHYATQGSISAYEYCMSS